MRSLFVLPLLLAGCSPAEEDAPAPTSMETPALEPAVELEGYWRVAGIDGEPFDASYAIALVADEDSIWWEPECALQYRDYSISGDTFTAPMRSNANLEVCDIGFPEELPQIWSALEAADRIERTPQNGVQISGNGRSVTLFSQ
ncbi:hypothetical protein K3152_12285 [Qipengyuania sp. 1NDH17]|uniref:META domain-containing protein n=1 Tax=Qipengyuania polymorpha TaxID=2867234 RepID=A0ABS7J113_9SPHN|nr:hypothetical protein [Qipengyuania polymorpha]MBX7459029.1 hypothetical protein [Qipengyuania polymorpha]